MKIDLKLFYSSLQIIRKSSRVRSSLIKIILNSKKKNIALFTVYLTFYTKLTIITFVATQSNVRLYVKSEDQINYLKKSNFQKNNYEIT